MWHFLRIAGTERKRESPTGEKFFFFFLNNNNNKKKNKKRKKRREIEKVV